MHLLLSAVATDTAARHALAYAGVSSAQNPFTALEAAGIASLQERRVQLGVARASLAVSAASANDANALRQCSIAELSATYQILAPAYAEAIEQVDSAKTLPALLELTQGNIALPESALSQLPDCAEAFHLRWWIGEVMGNAMAAPAFEIGDESAAARLLATQSESSRAKVSAVLDRITTVVNGVETPSRFARFRDAPACSGQEAIYFGAYILPELGAFTDAALALTNEDGIGRFIEHSFAIRDLLWSYTPRCAEALEIGMKMRRVASDFIAALALETAGVAAVEIPNLQTVVANLEDAIAETEDFLTEGGVAVLSGNVYYVIADDIANIRSCGSTACNIVTIVRRGQALNVVDDLTSWYKVELSDGESGYIASFLVSRTRPG